MAVGLFLKGEKELCWSDSDKLLDYSKFKIVDESNLDSILGPWPVS